MNWHPLFRSKMNKLRLEGRWRQKEESDASSDSTNSDERSNDKSVGVATNSPMLNCTNLPTLEVANNASSSMNGRGLEMMTDDQARTAVNRTENSNSHQVNNTTESTQEPPLSPWGNKCTAKKNIIQNLLDEDSDIHLLTKEQVWIQYAPRYDRSKCLSNLRYLMTQFKEKTGPFSSTSIDSAVELEPWTTRKARSKAWALLFSLFMDRRRTGIDKMSPEEIHQSEGINWNKT